MGEPAKAIAYIELEDYLVLENASRYRHEYLDGVIYAVQGAESSLNKTLRTRGMAGGSATHADLIRNTGFALHAQLRGSPCSVKMSEMRLRIESAGAVFYPDVLVHCQQPSDPSTTMELTEARLVVEVLSPTTAAFDRTDKLAAYQQPPGLQHIVFISSTEQAAWWCERETPVSGDVAIPAKWTDVSPWVRGTTLNLRHLGVSLDWHAIYGGVGLS